MRRSYICLAAFAVCLFACGRKTSVKPPELVRPEPIENLAAAGSPEGIALTWARPNRYVDGSRMDDLGRFIVERSDNQAEFRPLVTLPVADRDRFRKIRRLRYLDTTAVTGVHYRYRVIAATLDDYVSMSSNVVEIVAGDPASLAPTPTPPEPGKP